MSLAPIPRIHYVDDESLRSPIWIVDALAAACQLTIWLAYRVEFVACLFPPFFLNLIN